MLTENYKNALKGFKAQAQGNTSHYFNGCEAESQHIYRIIMTESVSVVDMDETKLESFITKENEGKKDYSKYHDREGLQYVDLGQNVDIYPCVGDTYLEPISGETYCLSSLEVKKMLNQLKSMDLLGLITDTLQSLSQKQDGTKLQTALPAFSDVKKCISSGLVLPQSLVEKINYWETLECSVINFDFEEQKS